MPATTGTSLTSNPYINGVLSDVKWAVANFSYSFPTSGSFYHSGYGNGEPVTGFAPLNTAQQLAAKSAFAMISAVANVQFTQITETASQHADLRLAASTVPTTAWAYYPHAAPEGGDSWFGLSRGYYTTPIKGNYASTTFLHEIGHAMGLEHTHEGNVMPVDRDSMEYSVMSYRSFVGASTTAGYTNETYGYAQSLMMYDIAALQHMYGANFSTNGGNTVYTWSATTGEMFINGVGQGAPGANRIFLTVWDGGGVDTYDFSNYATALQIDLRPGEWSITSTAQLAKLHYNGSKVAVGNIANALQYHDDVRSLIENAKGGSGHDKITGNAAPNALWGNAGNDSLSGGDGNDDLTGGAGADRLDGGAGVDMANYSASALGLMADLMSSSANTGEAAGDSYLSIEGLTGSQFSDTLRGDNLANLIIGLGGNDAIVGRGGSDTLIGGLGNDTLTGGAGADRLEGNDGIDTVSYADAPALSAYARGLLIDLLFPSGNTGEATGDVYISVENVDGSAFHDDIRGTDAANELRGLAGNDILSGRGGNDVLRGGDGADTLIGGLGDDMLFGGAGSDVFVFAQIDSIRPIGDVIHDFARGYDKLDLRLIDANTQTTGDQAFTFLGGNAFSGKAGQLNLVGQVLSGDTNGDGVADFRLEINVLTMSNSDFYL